MQYIGGKQKSGGNRIAQTLKEAARAIQADLIDERFCGALSITSRLGGLAVDAADLCEPLITLYDAIRCGRDPPAVVSRETWESYRDNPDPADPMTAFVGFGCSRSGAWFGSFIERFKRTGQNYVPAATAARESLARKLRKCDRATFSCRDYRDRLPRGVVYCDIPYADSIGYPAVGDFDHAAFWSWASECSSMAPIFVSEKTAPDGWLVAGEWSLQSRIATASGRRRVERLYLHERWSDLIAGAKSKVQAEPLTRLSPDELGVWLNALDPGDGSR